MELYFILVIICLFSQHKLCYKSISPRKKMMIPTCLFLLSILATVWISNLLISNNTLSASSSSSEIDQTITQVNSSEESNTYEIRDSSGNLTATIEIGKNNIQPKDVLKLLLLFNLPTFLCAIYYFTGRHFLSIPHAAE